MSSDIFKTDPSCLTIKSIIPSAFNLNFVEPVFNVSTEFSAMIESKRFVVNGTKTNLGTFEQTLVTNVVVTVCQFDSFF